MCWFALRSFILTLTQIKYTWHKFMNVHYLIEQIDYKEYYFIQNSFVFMVNYKLWRLKYDYPLDS